MRTGAGQPEFNFSTMPPQQPNMPEDQAERDAVGKEYGIIGEGLNNLTKDPERGWLYHGMPVKEWKEMEDDLYKRERGERY